MNRRLARAFIDAVSAGDLPDSLLTPDMTAWIATGGTMDKAAYQHLVRLLGAMCNGPLAFTIDSLTAEEDRVVIEARSEGLLVSGETYAQTYIFVLRIRGERIASVAEHYNALIVQSKLLPLMKVAQGKLAGDAERP